MKEMGIDIPQTGFGASPFSVRMGGMGWVESHCRNDALWASP